MKDGWSSDNHEKTVAEMIPREGFFNPWRRKWYPRAAAFAVVASILISFLGGKEGGGGDYPAFYSAGHIVLDTTGKRLYTYKDEEAIQKELFPQGFRGWGGAKPFPYPAFFALLYYPFSLVNYRLSLRLHTLLMILVIILATWLLAREHPHPGGYRIAASVAMLYAPMLAAIIGGQNTPITFLLYVAVWKAESSGRDWLAGLFLGLMLFKPQFAIPLMGLHLLSGRYRTVTMSIVVAAGLYLIGAVTYGPHWIGDWFPYASWVSGIAMRIDTPGFYSVCWLGFLQAFLGVDSRMALILGYALSLATVGLISIVWYQGRHDPDLSARFGLAPVALILMSPHAVYYDLGVLLFTYAMCLARKKRSVILVGLMWFLSPLGEAGNVLGISSLLLLLSSGALAFYVLVPDGIKTWRLSGIGGPA
jgi:hypothetical protein